jgi:biopolymer transport protein ExbB
LRSFHLEAVNLLLRGQDAQDLRGLCARSPEVPLARLVEAALDRLNAREPALREGWWEAAERRRQTLNLELRQNLWVLGTIASAAPFIGLFGTVVGILQSFKEMAEKGVGGFAVVASGISEALVATAAGILVAVIALMAYNAFQNHWNSLVLLLKIQSEELGEVLSRTLARAEGEKPRVEG